MKQAKIPRFLGALFFIYDISPSIQIQQHTHLAKRDAEPEHTRRIFFLILKLNILFHIYLQTMKQKKMIFCFTQM